MRTSARRRRFFGAGRLRPLTQRLTVASVVLLGSAPAHACHRHVMISGKVYRTVSEQCWSPSRRLADLDGMGLARQAISPMPELLSYWMEAPAAQQVRTAAAAAR